eukprot:scaffold388_cov114-Cylindrotheca_fusiformis.AAC.19
MKSLFLKSSIIVALSFISTEARDWQDVIDHALYLRSGVDTARMQLRIEWDPFSKSAPPHTHSKVTMMPSAAPTVGPCHEGSVHYQVNMYDSSGNGWERTSIQVVGIEDKEPVEVSNYTTSTQTHTLSTNEGNGFVSISNTVEFGSGAILSKEAEYVFPLGVIFESELTRGSYDYADICLVPDRCYDIVVNGEDLLEEVTWDITAMVDNWEQDSEAHVQGTAPMYCKFSIPNEKGQLFCPVECTDQIPDHYISKSPHLTDILHAPVDTKYGESPFSSLFQRLYTSAPQSTTAPTEAAEQWDSLLELGEETSEVEVEDEDEEETSGSEQETEVEEEATLEEMEEEATLDIEDEIEAEEEEEATWDTGATEEKEEVVSATQEYVVSESQSSQVSEQGEAESDTFQNLLKAGGD